MFENQQYDNYFNNSNQGSPSSSWYDPIFTVLNQFDRPRNAVATAVRNITDDDPNTGFFRGLYEGGIPSNRKTVGWGDVLGLPQAKPTDDWLPWLGKSALSLGADIALDPLTFVTGPLGRALKVPEAMKRASALSPVHPIRYAKEAVADSPVGAAFSHGLTQTRPEYERFESGIPTIMREGNKYDIRKAGGEAMEGYKKTLAELAEQGYTPGTYDVSNYLERGMGGQEAQRLGSFWKPVQEMGQRLGENINTVLARLGMPEAKLLQDIEYFPRFLTPEAKEMVRKNPSEFAKPQRGPFGDIDYNAKTGYAHRDIQNWIDKETGEIVKIGKEADKRTGVTWTRDEGYKIGDRFVDPVSSSLEEAASVVPENFFSTNPQGLTSAALRKREMLNFLNIAEHGLDSGVLRKVGEGTGKGYKLNIPGFEGYEAISKQVAHRFNNLGKQMFDPSTPVLGQFGQIMEKLGDTRTAENFKDFSTWWKRNVLALHPGYHVGNVVSNQLMNYQSGMNPLMIPIRDVQSALIQKGIGPDVIEGMTNAAMREEALKRGIFGHGALYGDIAQEGTDKVGRLRGLANRIENPILSKMMGGVATGAETMGKWNTWGLEKGSMLEDNAKLAAMVDWIKKNEKGFATMAPEERALALDRASQHAKASLLDYGSLTPFEEGLRNIIPFYAWSRLSGGRTYQLAKEHPERLAALDRFINQTTTPLSPEEKKVAPEWMKDQGPIKGIAGGKFPGIGKDNIFLTGRFLPQGNLQQAVTDPTGFMWSSMNPAIKAPVELLMNRDVFKGKPIDELAGGAGTGLFNALTGAGPYSKAEQQKLGWNPPNVLNYLMGQMPGGRYLNEISKAGDTFGLTENKLERKLSPREFLGWWGTGSKLFPFDYERAKKGKAFEEKKQIGAIAKELKAREMKGDEKGAEFYRQALEEAKANAQFNDVATSTRKSAQSINPNTGVPDMVKGMMALTGLGSKQLWDNYVERANKAARVWDVPLRLNLPSTNISRDIARVSWGNPHRTGVGYNAIKSYLPRAVSTNFYIPGYRRRY